MILRISIISIAVVIYFITTMQYFFALKRNVVFTGKMKTFHLIMIWLVPFIWIFILKSLTTSIPGYHEIKNKTNYKPFSDNDDDALKASESEF